MNAKECLFNRRLSNKWERVLWKKQNYPDNYVGDSFFRVSTKCVKIDRIEAFYGSIVVSQEICSCVGLVAIFWGLSEKQIETSSVLLLTGIISCLGYLVTKFPDLFSQQTESAKTTLSLCLDELKAALFTVVLTWFSSPIIKTLTASVATDTIHACTIGLLLLHLVLHPYGADVAIVNPTMSHNLGLFAAVCLASRLDNDLDVFALVIVAVGFFNLLPSFRFYCQETFGKMFFVMLFLAIFIGCILGLLAYAPPLCPIFLMVIVFVNGFSPFLFIYLQAYRKNIYGPWDEALIKEDQ